MCHHQELSLKVMVTLPSIEPTIHALIHSFDSFRLASEYQKLNTGLAKPIVFFPIIKIIYNNLFYKLSFSVSVKKKFGTTLGPFVTNQ